MPESAVVEPEIVKSESIVAAVLLVLVAAAAPVTVSSDHESYAHEAEADSETSAEAAETPPIATKAVVARRTLRILYLP
jgi:uncharacterized protein (UPF0333 family)